MNIWEIIQQHPGVLLILRKAKKEFLKQEMTCNLWALHHQIFLVYSNHQTSVGVLTEIKKNVCTYSLLPSVVLLLLLLLFLPSLLYIHPFFIAIVTTIIVVHNI